MYNDFVLSALTRTPSLLYAETNPLDLFLLIFLTNAVRRDTTRWSFSLLTKLTPGVSRRS